MAKGVGAADAIWLCANSWDHRWKLWSNRSNLVFKSVRRGIHRMKWNKHQGKLRFFVVLFPKWKHSTYENSCEKSWLLHSFITTASQIFLHACNFHHLEREQSLFEENSHSLRRQSPLKDFVGFYFFTNKHFHFKTTYMKLRPNKFICTHSLRHSSQEGPNCCGNWRPLAALTRGHGLSVKAGTHISYLRVSSSFHQAHFWREIKVTRGYPLFLYTLVPLNKHSI